jgi:hypothetical protein
VFSQNFSPVDALQRAQAFIYNTVNEQANYWAYVDAFYMLMWACGLCLLAAGLFQNVRSTRAVAVH